MRLYPLAAACSFCGTAPPVKITEEEREKHELDNPSLIVGTVRCPRCHRVNALTAGAYQGAGLQARILHSI